MSMPHGAPIWAVLVLACCPLLYYAVAIDSTRRWRRRASAARLRSGFAPPISVLKPVRGLDRDAAEHFTSFCRQDYPDYEVLFGVADAHDPAIPIITRVAEQFPRLPIRLIVGAPEIGASGKVNTLCRLAREARHDVLVISDSDVTIPPGHLRAIAAPFADAGVGAVTCLYRGISDGRFWSDLEAIGISTDFIPGVLVANRLEGMTFMLGATMATTRQSLAGIGGFEAFADYCADDFELGHRIAAQGQMVVLADTVAATGSAAPDGLGYLRHQLRWAITVRQSRPFGYVGRVAFTQGLPWTLAAMLLAPSATFAAVCALAYLVSRCAMAWIAAGAVGDGTARRKLYLVPIADAFACAVSIAALCSNRINWRGRWFELRKGRLVPSHASTTSPAIRRVRS